MTEGGGRRLQGGFDLVLSGVVRLVLLAIVLGEVVFLASRVRLRADLTADRLYTLTPVTGRVLSRLEDRLLIEAWFSADETLAAGDREARATLRAFLAELDERGGERVAVRYFDPHSDVELRSKAERLGIEPRTVQDIGGPTLSNIEVWQGLRFRYGSEHKVVPFIGFSDRTADYERNLTPLIKALAVAEKPKVGFVQWPVPAPEPAPGGPREPAPRFDRMRQAIGERYDVVDVELAEGQHVPPDIRTLVLVRPHSVTDRQKYVFDQFLMRGGRLVVFADGDDVSLGQGRRLVTREVPWDAPGSKSSFREQLRHYGVEVGERFLLDAFSTLPDAERFRVLVGFRMNGNVVTRPSAPIDYPYWVRPDPRDWDVTADHFATDPENGGVDRALAAQLRATFEPGISEAAQRALVAPTLFWPVAVDVAPLPEGVAKTTLMRTSPRTVQEAPQRSVSPVGDGSDGQAALEQFVQRLYQLFRGEPPQQHGLVVDLSGGFESFFTGREVPRNPLAEREAQARETVEDPLAAPPGSDPLEESEEPVVGPEAPEAAESAPVADDEPPQLTQAAEGARLVVIGDTDFVRDDVTSGAYVRIGGPASAQGLFFFAALIDWLAEDRDLIDLMGKSFTDRSLKLVESAGVANAADRTVAARDKATLLRNLNLLMPPALLALAGVAVWLRRRTRKRMFLARLQGR